MTDLDTLRQTMADHDITISDLARHSGLSPSHVGKQVRGGLPLQGRVRRALVGVLDARALADLPNVARFLREHGEGEAADACERLAVLLNSTGDDSPS